jgi:hypothetical protein
VTLISTVQNMINNDEYTPSTTMSGIGGGASSNIANTSPNTSAASSSSSSSSASSSSSSSSLKPLSYGINNPLAIPCVSILLKTNSLLQNQLFTTVHNLEVMNHLFTFADPRISLIVYGVCFGTAFLIMFCLLFVSVNMIVTVFLSTFLFILATYEFFHDQLNILPEQSKYRNIVTKVSTTITLIHNLLAKVPDELELQHR